MVNRRVFLLGALGTLAACDDRRKVVLNHAARFRFIETEEHRTLIADASRLVNDLVSPDVSLRLRPSWIEGDAAATGGDISVYSIRLINPGQFGLAFSYANERCVFVDSDFLPNIQSVFGGEQEEADTTALLALVLLHEVGHFTPPGSGSMLIMKGPLLPAEVSNSAAKLAELEADAFAGRQIRDGFHLNWQSKRFHAAAKLALKLPMMAFNLAGRRMIDHFGADAVGNPLPYSDASNSHPNLELRILLLNYYFNPSNESRDGVIHFLNRRAAAETPPKFRLLD